MYLLTFFSVSVSVRRSDLCAHGMAYIPVPSPPTAARAEAALPGSPGAPRLPSSGAPRSASGSTPLGSGAPPAAGPPSTCPPPAAAEQERRGPGRRPELPAGRRGGTGPGRQARCPAPGAGRGERKPPPACLSPAPCAACTWRGRASGGRGLPRAAGAPRHLLRRPERAPGSAAGEEASPDACPVADRAGPGEKPGRRQIPGRAPPGLREGR